MRNLKISLYEKAFKIRALEQEISKRYKKNKMRCPVHLSIGQESVSAAFSIVVRKNDYAVSTHRGHAHFLAKGGELKKLIAEIYGKKTGCSQGKGGSMHLIDLKSNFMGTSAIVANSIPTGVGLGYSAKFLKKNQISFVFLGDAATEEGVFYESINFSVIKKVPVIFICENNFYSVYSPLSVRQPERRKIHKMCNALGIKSLLCDGSNLLKTYKIIKQASDYVRKFKKPFFIEFETYRFLEHCGPDFDNHLKYRSQKEFDYWKSKDPIPKLRKELLKKNKRQLMKIEKKINHEINNAFDFAEKSKFPNQKDAYKGVYAK